MNEIMIAYIFQKCNRMKWEIRIWEMSRKEKGYRTFIEIIVRICAH